PGTSQAPTCRTPEGVLLHASILAPATSGIHDVDPTGSGVRSRRATPTDAARIPAFLAAGTARTPLERFVRGHLHQSSAAAPAGAGERRQEIAGSEAGNR